MSIRIDLPIASAAVYPNMCSAAGFHEVMMLVRSLVMMASSDDSTTAASRRLAAAASVRSLISRATLEAPMTRPAASRIGERVSEIGMSVPSFRCRIVSKCGTPSPALTRVKTASSSFCRSAGMIMRID